MTKQWVRQEIHRNEIALFLEKIIKFYQNNRESVIAGAGIGIVLIAVIVYFIMQYRSLNIRAWDQLSYAQNRARAGNADQAELKYLEVARNFRRTPAAVHAMLSLAELYATQKNYQKASETYQQTIVSYSNDVLLPFAFSGYGATLINMGNLDKAIEIYQQFSDRYADHFIYPLVLQSLAFCYEKTGEIDEARSQYEKLITLYPQTIWAENAYAWLNLLDKGKK